MKHEWVYLHPAADGIEQKRSLGEFFDWYGGAVNLWTVGCAEPRRNGRAA